MTDKRKIYEFAVKYVELYKDMDTLEHEVEEWFADQCFALKFEMDCGKAIEKAFPHMNVSDTRVFKRIVRQIDDPALLGSAIFSKWRYITHWSYGESLLSEENRPWFMAAFTRLIELTDMIEYADCGPPLLKGKARKIRIVSDGFSFGHLPMPEEEVEQHLTIYEDGRVWFSGYNYGDGCKYIRGRRKQFKMKKGQADRIFAAYNQFFSTEYIDIFATDIGTWNMTITNTEGVKFRFCGSLIADFEVDGEDLSEMMREELKIENLWVFDGDNKPDRVDRITVDYCRMKENNLKQPGSRSTEYIECGYTERLMLDRDSETIEHVQNNGSGCTVSRKFEVEGGVVGLLDDLDADDLFHHIAGNPPDVMETPPYETRNYTITIDFKKKPQQIIQGSFDKYGLPDDWADFAKSVCSFMRSYGFGEILHPAVYGKTKRCKADYMYCSVIFEDGYKSYYYIADDESIEVGDFVLVPVGTDCHTAIVEVVDIEYFKAADVPLPLDQTKHIIRKCTADDIEPQKSMES